VLSHEILNANPYAFLDDAPLEERRARAVAVRRGLGLPVKLVGVGEGAGRESQLFLGLPAFGDVVHQAMP